MIDHGRQPILCEPKVSDRLAGDADRKVADEVADPRAGGDDDGSSNHGPSGRVEHHTALVLVNASDARSLGDFRLVREGGSGKCGRRTIGPQNAALGVKECRLVRKPKGREPTPDVVRLEHLCLDSRPC